MEVDNLPSGDKKTTIYDLLQVIPFIQTDPSPNILDFALMSYDDLFSDFDPTDYSKRELSDDFLKELMRRNIEKLPKKITLRFLLPSDIRVPKIEQIIKNRLRHYFHEMLTLTKEQEKNIKREGSMLLAGGFIFLIGVYYVNTVDVGIFPESIKLALEVLFTPFGWFGMWEGLNIIRSARKETRQKKIFEKLSTASIVFADQEEVIKEIITISEEKEKKAVVENGKKN